MTQTISLCMITKNEDNNLAQSLNSVKDLVNEIIIVDTGSTDKTITIAREFDSNIFEFSWNDSFSEARNESLRHATKDWILVLDADELVEKRDFSKIKDAIESAPKEVAGFSLQQRSYIRNFSSGAAKNESQFFKDFPFYVANNLVRLFKNNNGLKFKNRIHELIEDSIKERNLEYKKTDIIIHHFGSVKSKQFIDSKTNSYSRLILKQLEDEPDNERYNYQAARMYLSKKDFTKALGFFVKTSKINPNYKLVFSEIAKIYLQMNDKNRAIEYFKKSLRQNPESSCANNLAVIYMSMGKFEQAKEILEEWMKNDPNNEALKHNYNECLKN